MYYVINVKTGKENETIEAIKKELDGKEGFDIFAPYRKVLKKYKGGVIKEVIERCFPGYLFVETDNPEELFFGLYWVPGYTRLLGREGLTYNFAPLSKEESRMIDILYSKNTDRITEISDIVVEQGQIVRVLDGPLEGMLTKVTKVNLHKRTVTVSFNLCGRLVHAEVGINIITDVV